MWTIIGKKVAGKARGSTPISPDEAKALISLLIDRNPNYRFIPFISSNLISVKKPLKIDYATCGDNPQVEKLSDFHPNDVPFFWTDHSIKYEKVLETIFNQELSAKNRAFFNQIDVDIDKVIWFSNYLPYSIEQSEMDYLIMESEDNNAISRVLLLEFMRGKIDESHIYRSMMYAKWINETLCYGTQISQPVVICSDCYDFINGETNKSKIDKANSIDKYIKNCEEKLSTKPLIVYTYDFSSGSPVFTKKR